MTQPPVPARPVRPRRRAARRARRRRVAAPRRDLRERPAAHLRPAARRRRPEAGPHRARRARARRRVVLRRRRHGMAKPLVRPGDRDRGRPATGSAAGPLAVHLARHGVRSLGHPDRDPPGRRDGPAVDAARPRALGGQGRGRRLRRRRRARRIPRRLMFDSETFAALASPKRLQILEWLKDPRANFPPQRDGDLVEDGVCVRLHRRQARRRAADRDCAPEGARPGRARHVEAPGRLDVLQARRAARSSALKREIRQEL